MNDFEIVPVGTIVLLRKMLNRKLNTDGVYACDCCNSMWGHIFKNQEPHHSEDCELKKLLEKLDK